MWAWAPICVQHWGTTNGRPLLWHARGGCGRGCPFLQWESRVLLQKIFGILCRTVHLGNICAITEYWSDGSDLKVLGTDEAPGDAERTVATEQRFCFVLLLLLTWFLKILMIIWNSSWNKHPWSFPLYIFWRFKLKKMLCYLSGWLLTNLIFYCRKYKRNVNNIGILWNYIIWINYRSKQKYTLRAKFRILLPTYWYEGRSLNLQLVT